MRGRLMVGHHPLEVTILVRIQAPQFTKVKESPYGRFFGRIKKRSFEYI